MRFWWVNQGSTYRHEVPGGYLWSPKRNKGGGFSPYYDNMTRIEPGDVVLSYAGSAIRAVGIAVSAAYDAPKPEEFGSAGSVWAELGWRVDVSFSELPKDRRLRPKDYIAELRPLAPSKYSPIKTNGDSISFYLFEMPEPFAQVLLTRIESAAEWRLVQELQKNDLDLRRIGEEKVEAFLERAPLDETEKKALIAARRGQGRFREGVSYVEPACRFTGVENPALLVASHIQPWHRCHTNDARLDPFNGLMLTPTYDRLFDRGFVTFSEESQLIVSKDLPEEDITKIRMDRELELAPFRPEQLKYLAYHRENVFRAA